MGLEGSKSRPRIVYSALQGDVKEGELFVWEMHYYVSQGTDDIILLYICDILLQGFQDDLWRRGWGGDNKWLS